MAKNESQNGTGVIGCKPKGVRVTNTSGFPGVSWHKAGQKWGAYIRRDGKRRFLGLYATAEAAHAAYLDADRTFSQPPPSRNEEMSELLATARNHYEEHGLDGLRRDDLRKAKLFTRMEKLAITQAELIEALGLSQEFARSRRETFKYRGVEKPRWNWDQAVTSARALLEHEGDLPTIPWCRKNGHSQLVNVVFQTGHMWEELREAVGLSSSARFFQSRSGVRWRSRPEACLSNYLHARGVEHKRGEAYPASYAAASGRTRAQYDLHFRAGGGRWIDVEVWGNLSGEHFGGDRYSETRAMKEAWNGRHNANFIGIDHGDCLSDARLQDVLAHLIDKAAPIAIRSPTDALIETAHWSHADELLESCRQIAGLAPGGVFPTEDWLRKRGRYADREGQAYNSVAVYVQRWLGGTRKVRELLGQAHASTTQWSEAEVKEQWAAFERANGLSPRHVVMPNNRGRLAADIAAEASRIWTAANRLDVRDAELGIRQGRPLHWTRDRVLTEWATFVEENGCQPTECMSASRRRSLPRALCAKATNVYSAAARLDIVAECRAGGGSSLGQSAQQTV